MIRVLYFAAARERAGVANDELDAGGKTVAAVMALVVERRPALAAVLAQCRVAVDQVFAKSDAIVPDGAEVAIIPPVSGGAAGKAVVLDTSLSVDAALTAVKHPGAGAIVVMLGTVRDHVSIDGRVEDGVDRLEYEAYAAMAEGVMGAIVEEAEQRWPGVRGHVLHRTGSLQVGDTAVVVAASAAHRAAAFDACEHIIDRLKQDAPIWKREHRTSGTVWVGLGP